MSNVIKLCHKFVERLERSFSSFFLGISLVVLLCRQTQHKNLSVNMKFQLKTPSIKHTASECINRQRSSGLVGNCLESVFFASIDPSNLFNVWINIVNVFVCLCVCVSLSLFVCVWSGLCLFFKLNFIPNSCQMTLHIMFAILILAATQKSMYFNSKL